MLDTLRETWLTDEEYNVQKGMLLEHQRIVEILQDIEKRYYKAGATTELGLHPFRVAIRELEANLPVDVSKD
jgi:hypothetical protein